MLLLEELYSWIHAAPGWRISKHIQFELESASVHIRREPCAGVLATTSGRNLEPNTIDSPSPNCTYTNNSPPVGYRSLSLNIADGAQLSNDSGMPLDCHDYSTDSSSSNGRDEEEPAFRDSLPNTLRPTVLPSTSTLPDFTMY